MIEDTVVDDPDAPTEIPHGCITASELRSLAIALDRLTAWHNGMGGPAPGAPCVRRVTAVARGVRAEVEADGQRHTLALESGADWALIPAPGRTVTK